MRLTTSNEIRQAFLDFFNEVHHEIVPSAPLPQRVGVGLREHEREVQARPVGRKLRVDVLASAEDRQHLDRAARKVEQRDLKIAEAIDAVERAGAADDG